MHRFVLFLLNCSFNFDRHYRNTSNFGYILIKYMYVENRPIQAVLYKSIKENISNPNSSNCTKGNRHHFILSLHSQQKGSILNCLVWQFVKYQGQYLRIEKSCDVRWRQCVFNSISHALQSLGPWHITDRSNIDTNTALLAYRTYCKLGISLIYKRSKPLVVNTTQKWTVRSSEYCCCLIRDFASGFMSCACPL